VLANSLIVKVVEVVVEEEEVVTTIVEEEVVTMIVEVDVTEAEVEVAEEEIAPGTGNPVVSHFKSSFLRLPNKFIFLIFKF
jgi:hypothetical protein